VSVKLKKTLLLLLAAVLLVGVSQVQNALNRDRDKLGLTRTQPLENAPPVLAFTTVALGGFRGLISNALWIRANDLQDDDKFFEAAQLADWITKLEPHFVQVWIVQAWNMAYNISVKFKDYSDRWRWVNRGIELLRDEGLRYNPNEILLYRELAWFFQHKMGANLDDANMYYKQQWANQMARVFATNAPNLDELINPQTADQRARLALLTNEYKMDPKFMKEVDQRYGPLEWRLPESHAIYWAAKGLEAAKEHPDKVKQDDKITLERVIYQCMQLSFQRGRMIANPYVRTFTFGPNIDIIPKVSAAYEKSANEDKNYHDHILNAHRNFLRDAVYFLYVNNRIQDAAYWFKYLGEHYPDKTILDGDPNSFPRNVTLDDYCVGRVEEDVKDTNSRDRIKAIIEGMLATSYERLAIGQDQEAAGYALLAEKVRTTYESKTASRTDALRIEPMTELKREVLDRLLDPVNEEFPFAMRAALRTKLGMGPEPATQTPVAPGTAPATSAGPGLSTNPLSEKLSIK
jgi:hypothetical protein